MRSIDLDINNAEKKFTEFTNPKEIHDFVEGETRRSIIKAAGKMILVGSGLFSCHFFCSIKKSHCESPNLTS